jgi:hypothetical protein
MIGVIVVGVVWVAVFALASRRRPFDDSLPEGWVPSRTVLRQQSTAIRFIRGE